MTLASATRSPLSFRSLAPLSAVSIAVGLSGALTLPFMALFLTDEVHASPAALGAFMLISPLAGLVASTILGRLSDARAVRRNLLVAGAIAGAAGSALFAVVRDYWVLLAISVTLLAIASSLLAQMFAYARQSLERSDSPRAPFVISVLRTLLSLSWVGGPPLAALLLAKTGFTGLFVASAVFYAVVATITIRLPELGASRPVQTDMEGGPVRGQIVFAAAAFVLLQGASALGVNAMPLFLTDVLHGTTTDAGLVLGLCAALEIPLILGFGVLAVKTDQRRIVMLGGIVALAYQGVMLTTTQVWQVLAAQVLSAIVISAVLGMGITYFQSLAPGRPGFASTLYANTLTVGMMVAGPLLGLAQQLGYRTAYLMSLVMSAFGIVTLIAAGARATKAQ